MMQLSLSFNVFIKGGPRVEHSLVKIGEYYDSDMYNQYNTTKLNMDWFIYS